MQKEVLTTQKSVVKSNFNSEKIPLLLEVLEDKTENYLSSIGKDRKV